MVSVLHTLLPVDTPGLLFVTPWLAGGGIERNLEVKAPALVRRGHRVGVASWQVAERLSGQANPVLASLRTSGVRIVPLPAAGLLRQAARVAALAAREGYRVVVGHELLGNVVALLARALTAGRLRGVGEFHNSPSTYVATGASPRVLAVARRLYRHADALVAVSERLRREQAAFFGVPGARIVTIYNPFDLARLRRVAAEPDAALDARPPFVVACGRLAAIKGFGDLIAAFARVRQRRLAPPAADVRLVILGDGPDREALAAAAVAHGVGDLVELPGFVAEPVRHFARARCFVLSSLSEGLPRVVLEAMACGTPVIASRCGGVEEVVEDGKTGRLYAPGDVAGLALALALTLDDRPGAADLARAAKARADDFDEDRVLPRLEETYLG